MVRLEKLESLDQGSNTMIFFNIEYLVKLFLNFCLFLLLGIQIWMDKIYIYSQWHILFFLFELLANIPKRKGHLAHPRLLKG